MGSTYPEEQEREPDHWNKIRIVSVVLPNLTITMILTDLNPAAYCFRTISLALMDNVNCSFIRENRYQKLRSAKALILATV